MYVFVIVIGVIDYVIRKKKLKIVLLFCVFVVILFCFFSYVFDEGNIVYILVVKM